MYLDGAIYHPNQPAQEERLAHPPDRLCRIIVYAISIVFDVEAAALRMQTRGSADIAFARQVAMYLAHVGCGLSLSDTGRLFGRDRTTVAHACSLVEDRRDDARIDRTLDLLEAVVGRLAGVRLALRQLN